MAPRITETYMADDETGHHAEPAAGGWTCSRLPGRLLSRDQAAGAMRLAALEYAGYSDSPAAARLRAELGLGP